MAGISVASMNTDGVPRACYQIYKNVKIGIVYSANDNVKLKFTKMTLCTDEPWQLWKNCRHGLLWRHIMIIQTLVCSYDCRVRHSELLVPFDINKWLRSQRCVFFYRSTDDVMNDDKTATMLSFKCPYFIAFKMWVVVESHRHQWSSCLRMGVTRKFFREGHNFEPKIVSRFCAKA